MSNLPEDLQERIAAYIDGVLSPAEAARLEVFLANTDPALAQQVIEMVGNKGMLRLAPKPLAPRDLSARVMEQIERASLLHNVEHLTAPRSSPWKSRGLIAAGLALVLGGFTYFMFSTVITPSNDHWRGQVAVTPPSAAPGAAAARERPTDAVAAKEGAAPREAIEGTQLATAGGSAPDPLREPPAMSKAGPAAPLVMEKGAPESLKAAATTPAPMIAAGPVAAPTINAPGGPAQQSLGAVGGARSTAAEPQARESEEARQVALGTSGSFGGGVRGAGGGGRGGRARANAQQAGISMDASAGSLATEASPPAAVLASLLNAPGDQPVVLSFVARDPADLGRLQETLQTYAAANGREGALLAPTAGSRPNYFDITNNYRQNTAPRGAGGLPGDQIGNQVGNAAGANNAAPQQVAGGWVSGNNSQAAQTSDQLFAQRAAQVLPDAADRQQQAADPAPPALRVLLKPEQIESLTSQYRVALIARGTSKHEFSKQVGDVAARTADPRFVEDLLRRARGTAAIDTDNRNTPELAATRDEGAATPPARTRAPDGAAGSNGIVQPALPATPRAAANVAADNNAPASAPAWVECLVTIEPPAAAAPASTAPAR